MNEILTMVIQVAMQLAAVFLSLFFVGIGIGVIVKGMKR
jgi:hypothetical protein